MSSRLQGHILCYDFGDGELLGYYFVHHWNSVANVPALPDALNGNDCIPAHIELWPPDLA